MTSPQLILASASPRRSQLLTQIGVQHSVLAQDIDESLRPGETPRHYVQRMAREKAATALAGSADVGKRLVLAADTSVVCADRVLGKPVDEEEAVEMLLSLSSRQHEVLTAVTVADSHRQEHALSISLVQFRAIAESEARAYWRTGEPRDKAGSYAIQGIGAIFVQSINGSYSGVMGLPLYESAQLLASFGVPVLTLPVEEKD